MLVRANEKTMPEVEEDKSSMRGLPRKTSGSKLKNSLNR